MYIIIWNKPEDIRHNFIKHDYNYGIRDSVRLHLNYTQDPLKNTKIVHVYKTKHMHASRHKQYDTYY